jgi:uncharacterized protein
VGRILLLLLIGLALYWLFRGFFRSQVKPPDAPASRDAEKMVACERCGVNLPQSEALAEGDRWVCRANPNCR